MAISPQYSEKWKIVPFNKHDESDYAYIVWGDVEYAKEAKPGWDLVAECHSKAMANHIIEMHNKWVDEWYNSLPFADEVEEGFCGNVRQRENSGTIV